MANSQINFEQEIINAIKTMVDRGINLAGYDQTVSATVIGILDSEKGEYQIKYQDSTVKAHTVIPGVDYPINSTVYVLIPKSDFSENDRIILWGDKATAIYSRALPISMITVKSDGEYDITTRRGVEKYVASAEYVPMERR